VIVHHYSLEQTLLLPVTTSASLVWRYHHLSLDKHVSNVCEVFFLASLDVESVKTLVHAFVTTHLDYCNSVLAGALRSATDKLQRVLNAAARLVSGTHKFDRGLSRLLHVDLHWLDVPERLQYKLGVTVHLCQQHKAPQYLIDCVTPASDIASRQRLRSSTVTALCQSSPTSCAALPTQLTCSSVLRCRWTDDLEFAVSWPPWSDV